MEKAESEAVSVRVDIPNEVYEEIRKLALAEGVTDTGAAIVRYAAVQFAKLRGVSAQSVAMTNTPSEGS